MRNADLVPYRARMECLGAIPAQPVALSPVGQLLDTVDIWLAGALQTLFDSIKR